MDDEIRQMVEEANKAFYLAIELRSLEHMEEIWSHEETVRCIHPGWDSIAGWSRVKESWAMIFEGGQGMRISPADISIHWEGDMAWVCCTETITVFNEESFDTAQTIATNLFIRRDGRWLMVHHHASPIPMIVPGADLETIQ